MISDSYHLYCCKYQHRISELHKRLIWPTYWYIKKNNKTHALSPWARTHTARCVGWSVHAPLAPPVGGAKALALLRGWQFPKYSRARPTPPQDNTLWHKTVAVFTGARTGPWGVEVSTVKSLLFVLEWDKMCLSVCVCCCGGKPSRLNPAHRLTPPLFSLESVTWTLFPNEISDNDDDKTAQRQSVMTVTVDVIFLFVCLF